MSCSTKCGSPGTPSLIRKHTFHVHTGVLGRASVPPAAVAVLVVLVLELVLELVSHKGTCKRAEHAVAAHLVAAKVAGGTASQRAHEAAVALGLRVGVRGTVALLAVGRLLALRILVLRVRALLRVLARRSLAWVLLLAVLAVGTCQRRFRNASRFGGGCLTLAAGHRELGSGRAGIRLGRAGRRIGCIAVAAARRSILRRCLAVEAGSQAADSLPGNPAGVAGILGLARAIRTGPADTAGCIGCIGCRGQTWRRWVCCGRCRAGTGGSGGVVEG
ncbi:hypothetical protein BS50DRAFT_413209 [Corynespora cassiicola Philippines]|uniref:Uncharacterized protein n=1 Tax=Corynespora cassiicola Philippines TaxID=1448308 RepID=A0A2T2NLX3_CORCC|nr:hypothetical protein BS50DRAFT_413209 [Corynespora cassiicola Philippines]